MMLFAISGSANSGKDACCNYVSKKHGFVKIAYADKIKRILMHLYNIDYDDLFGSSDKRSKIDPRYGKPIREFIQGFGEKGRELNENTWVNYAIEIIKKINNSFGYYYVDFDGLRWDGISSPKSVIVSDGRYLNELEAIRNLGGKIIRIKRSNCELKDKLGLHSSEVDQKLIEDSYFDEIIVNDGSLLDLYTRIDEILLKYK